MIMSSCGLRPEEVGRLDLGEMGPDDAWDAITHKIDPD